MLRNLDDDAEADWKSSLVKVAHAYNCTRNESTGYASYYLLFVRHPRLPIDIMFGIPHSDGSASHDDYAKKWKLRMEEAYQLASKAAKASGKGEKICMTERFKEQSCILAAEFSLGTCQKEVDQGNSGPSGALGRNS